MAEKDIQMTQRNSANTDWDNLYPKTKAENVIIDVNGNTVATHLEEKATSTTLGHVKGNTDVDGKLLADSVKLTDTASNFTATELEGAMSELFTYVADGKNSLETAIEAKGGTVSDVNIPPTFADLATGINGISTGKKYASGTTTSISDSRQLKGGTGSTFPNVYTVTVSGLDFKPNIVLLYSVFPNGEGENYTQYNGLRTYEQGVTTLMVGKNTAYNGQQLAYNIRYTIPSSGTALGSFTLPFMVSGVLVHWYAFE